MLEAGGVVYAEREAIWLMETATGRRAADLLAPGTVVGDEAIARVESLACRRAGGEPLQYLTGVAGFRKLELEVGPGVFIPRPETELVVERAMELLPPGGTAVDVGTGSGAIALSLALERPDAVVYATESSPSALAYAERNRVAIGLRVELIAGDLLDGLPLGLRRAVDVCVSNPPYVPSSERDALPRDVADHEPSDALFSGDDGLDVIRRLAIEARAWLAPGGWLVSELGDRQGEEVRAILASAGYRDPSVRRDLAGRERIAEGRA